MGDLAENAAQPLCERTSQCLGPAAASATAARSASRNAIVAAAIAPRLIIASFYSRYG
jgi:hypothetical protein